MSKKRIICLIMISLLLSGISVFATYLIESSDVGYDNSDSELEADNVQEAIDELFTLYENNGSGASGYTITYNAQNETENTTGSSEQKYGTLPTPTKSGYYFLGWYDAIEGGNKITSDTVINTDITIYAHWYQLPSGVTYTNKSDEYNYFSTPIEVLYNPKTRQKCTTNGGSTAGTMSDCMKWYAYSEKDGIVNMILDHNIANGIKWYNSSSPTNQNGPTTVLGSLKNLTNNAVWTTTVQGDYTIYYGKYSSQNIDYSEYKARLITAQEIAYIVGNDSWNEKSSSGAFYFGSLTTTAYSNQNATQKAKQESYGWLFANLYNCSSDGGCGLANNSTVSSGNRGYWSSSPSTSDTYNAWLVNSSGRLSYDNANVTSYGVRPVITVPVEEIFS